MNEDRIKNAKSVTDLNKYLQRIISDDYALQNVYVKGEISQVNYHNTGHVYFELKDEKSALRGIIYSNVVASLNFKLEVGQEVIVGGYVSFYSPNGTISLITREIEDIGYGKLNAEFEKLKNKLYEAGYFDNGYKSPIPKYPDTIGVVTSNNMAAHQDVFKTIKELNPYIKIIISPCHVQGENAKYEIVDAINRLQGGVCDTIIVTRGGGSKLDLWPFNEEMVAMAIFNSDTPVITGIGHEIDESIADYVADYHAITPTAAAHAAAYSYDELVDEIDNKLEQLTSSIEDKLYDLNTTIDNYSLRLANQNPLTSIRHKAELLKVKYASLTRALEDNINGNLDRIIDSSSRLTTLIKNITTDRMNRLGIIATKLEGLSPLKIFDTGYSYVENDNNKLIKSIKDVRVNEALNVHVKDGKINAIVKDIEKINRRKNG